MVDPKGCGAARFPGGVKLGFGLAVGGPASARPGEVCMERQVPRR